MTRLQKKCFIAVAGTHLLLVTAVLCSGFITSKPKPDDSQLLTAIPDTTIDAMLNSGIKSAQAPPPTPIVQPPSLPPPEPPKPETKPIEPPKIEEPIKTPEEIQPDNLKPVERSAPKPKPPKHEITPDLKPVVREHTKAADTAAAEAEKTAREQKRLRDARTRALRQVVQNLKKNFTPATEVELPGDSSAAYANYASIVKSVYTQAWVAPTDTASDDANVKVSVTIANSGRVISARIVDNSDDASVNRSVQKTLDRVTEIAPFPDGSTDRERTYIINFNLKAKRMLG